MIERTTAVDGSGELEAVLEWTRRSLPPRYLELIMELVADAKADPNVSGLLLTGSIARGDALPGTDIDVRCLRDSERPTSFERGFEDDLLVERTYTDEQSALAQLNDNPMHVYAYLDGRILYDRDGTLARLRGEADRIFHAYRAPKQLKVDLAVALGHPRTRSGSGSSRGICCGPCIASAPVPGA